MKGRGRGLVFVLIIAVGVLIFNYPTIATLVNDFFAYRSVAEYQSEVHAMDQAEIERTIELAQAYNQSLPLSFPADPFSGSNINSFEGTEFENFELVQDGAMIGYIEIPDIDVYQAIYYGTSEEVLNQGLGLVENTSLPVGSPGSHAVISGHTGMASRKLFSDLDKLEMNAVFFIHVLDRHFAYQVDQILVVLPDETEELAIRQGEDLVTLVTCTPFGINDHRLLVRGHRIDYDFSKQEQERGNIADSPRLAWYLALLAGAFLVVCAIWRVRRDRKAGSEADASDVFANDAAAIPESPSTSDSIGYSPESPAEEDTVKFSGDEQ